MVSSSKAMVDGERFTSAWINLDSLPGGMMLSNGKPIGPIPATTSCSITTSPTIVQQWRERGNPVIEVQLNAPETSERPILTVRPHKGNDVIVDATELVKWVSFKQHMTIPAAELKAGEAP